MRAETKLYTRKGWYHVRVPHREGNRRYYFKALDTKDRAEAGVRAKEIELAVRVKEQLKQPMYPKSFAEVCDEWLESENLSPSVAKSAPNWLKHWKAFMKAKHLENVTETLDYISFRNKRSAKPPSDQTLEIEIGTAKRVFSFAVKKNYITKLPEMPKLGRVRNNRRPDLTQQEQTKLRHHLNLLVNKDPSHKNQTLRALVLTLLYSGMRINSARKLKWSDVTEVITENGRETYMFSLGKVKTKEAYECVGQDKVKPVLDAHREFTRASDRDLVFTAPDGKPVPDWNNRFKTVAKNAGINSEATLYSLRHTYATNYLRFDKNPDIFRLAENMGTGVDKIQKHYSHLVGRDRIERFT